MKLFYILYFTEIMKTHHLFTPLLSLFAAAAGILCVILVILFYKYQQVKHSKTHTFLKLFWLLCIVKVSINKTLLVF